MRPKSALRNRAEWLATQDAWAEERGIALAIDALTKELTQRIRKKSQKTINQLVGLGDHAAIEAIASSMPESVMKFYAYQASGEAHKKAREIEARRTSKQTKPEDHR